MTEDEFLKYFNSKYWKTSSLTSGLVLMICDCIMVMLSIGTSFFIINLINHSWINFRSFVTYSVYLPLIIAVFYIAGLYPGISLSPAEEVKKSGYSSFFCFCGIAVSIIVETIDDKLPIVVAFILAVPFATVFLPVGRELVRHIISKRKWFGVPAVILAENNSGDFLVTRLLNRPDLGYKPALIIDTAATEQRTFNGIPVFPQSEKINGMIIKTGIKVIILCGIENVSPKINMHFRYVIKVPKITEKNSIETTVKDFGGILAFATTNNLTKQNGKFKKRALDLSILILSSPLVIPLVIIVSILIKVTSPGPVFFGHKRIGKNGKEFKCWKFRSMVADADKQLEKILAENPEMRAEWEKDRKFTNDPRVTKFGKFIRKTSIDEIPQFFNVLLGEMSFVGPRPVTTPELVKYGNDAEFILSVPPGISGMWQISGRSDTHYEERIILDSYYIQNWSFWLDVWIIIKTLYVVFMGKGAY